MTTFATVSLNMFKFLDNIAIADIAFQVEAPELPQLFTEAVQAFLEKRKPVFNG